MLAYLAQLGETVEELLPDHEGLLNEKLNIAKQIVEDERLLSNKGMHLVGSRSGCPLRQKEQLQIVFRLQRTYCYDRRRNHHGSGSDPGKYK